MKARLNEGTVALLNETLNGALKILELSPTVGARASDRIEWKHCTVDDDCPHESRHRCFHIAGTVVLKRDSESLEFNISGTRHEMLVGLSDTIEQWAPIRLDVVVNIPDEDKVRPVARQFELTPAQG